MTRATNATTLAGMDQPSDLSGSLHGRSFVLTRPVGESRALATRLRRRSARVCALAPFRLVALADRASVQTSLQAANKADVLVFASSYAVQHAFAACPGFSTDARVLAQGPATAKALAVHGIRAGLPESGFRSEDVLLHPWLARAHKVLRITGTGGRDWLVRQLRSRGVEADDVPVYGREMSTPRPHTLARIDTLTRPQLIVSHREALLALPGLLGSARWLRLAAAPMFVSSDRLAALARSMQCARVHVADSARPVDLLAAISAWR